MPFGQTSNRVESAHLPGLGASFYVLFVSIAYSLDVNRTPDVLLPVEDGVAHRGLDMVYHLSRRVNIFEF